MGVRRDELDTRMAALQSESTTLEARLCTPLPPLELAELGKRLKVVSAELQALEEKWLQLSEALAAWRWISVCDALDSRFRGNDGQLVIPACLSVIPGHDQWDGRPHLGGIVMCQSGGVYQPT